MAAKILDITDRGPLFVSIGAGHLSGDEGLVNLLVREGYSATALEPPE